jgi:hypothetical protein
MRGGYQSCVSDSREEPFAKVVQEPPGVGEPSRDRARVRRAEADIRSFVLLSDRKNVPNCEIAVDHNECQEYGSLADVEGVLLHKREKGKKMVRSHKTSIGRSIPSR